MAHEWVPPAVIASTPLRPLTATGAAESSSCRCPSWPALLRPQHLALPFARIAHEWSAPAAIVVASLKPLTVTGVEEFVVWPFPSWPYTFSPST